MYKENALQQELNQKVVLPGVIPAGELGQLRHTQALVVPVLQVYIHCKKRLSIFLSPGKVSLTKLCLAGNN
jgi:hypothetical protein